LATKDQGLAYNLSPRDLPASPVTVLTARLQRAFGNFRETFVYFAIAVLLVTVLVKESELSALGAPALCAGLCRRHPAGAHPGLGGVHPGAGAGAVVGRCGLAFLIRKAN